MNEERDVQMTPQEAAQELLARLADSGAAQSVSPALWIRDELLDTWSAARDDASAAYGYWSRLRTRESYAIYQAAQDRVDAAQDALACWADADRWGHAAARLVTDEDHSQRSARWCCAIDGPRGPWSWPRPRHRRPARAPVIGDARSDGEYGRFACGPRWLGA